LLIFLETVFVYAIYERLPVMGRWPDRPWLFVFPAIGVVAAIVLAESVGRRRDGVPFYMAATIFAAAFCTLAISFWPYMIPFAITIEQAKAPHSSLAFMFWGEGLFVFPLCFSTLRSARVSLGARSHQRHRITEYAGETILHRQTRHQAALSN
jgi:cytochrome d ubiquinol oxidase subunit II